MDHYSRLGMTRDCTASEIGRSYRRLIRIHHPDKGGSPTTFCQVHEAFTVLRNITTRQLYDSQDMTVSDLFGDDSTPPPVWEAKDTYHRLLVSLEDICSGKEIPLRVKRRLVKTQLLEECTHCLGTGIAYLMQNVGHVSNSSSEICLLCESGYVKDTISFDEVYTSNLVVSIPPGCPEGMLVRFHQQGDALPGHPISDLLVMIQYARSDDYDVVKNSLDLSRVLTITLLESLMGFTRSWSHPDGSTIRCSMETICKPGMYVIPERGIHSSEEGMYGHLYIQVEITYPMMITICPPGDLATMFHQEPTLNPMTDDLMLYDRIYPRTCILDRVKMFNSHV
jgi:DnaJ family protein A protein 2